MLGNLKSKAIEIYGDQKLKRTLRAIQGERSSVNRAALTGAMAVAKKAIRKGTNSATAPRSIKQVARAAIGSSVKKAKGSTEYVAKAGYGVGKPSKAQAIKQFGRSSMGQASAGGVGIKAGVGISARNIHWITLGTGQKSERQRKSGGRTGSTKPYLAGVIPTAMKTSKVAMAREAAKRAKKQLSKAIRKRR
jgi:hypothetical protein